nr:polysaccharide deacetylase family protein [Propionibacterium sp.]
MSTALARVWTLVCALALAAGLALAGPAPAATAAVKTCSSSTAVGSRPTLRLGDTGSCVTVLQRALDAQGWIVNVDGVFNDTTDKAVRRFQASWQYVAIDGIVGPVTWDKLVNGGGTKYSVSRGPNRTSKVMLTFDDCPKSYSAFQTTVLAAERLGIRLALFPYGQCRDWGLISFSYARAHGHYVFNHSTTHADLTTLSYSEVLDELYGGPSGSYGRPPYGAYNLTVKNAFVSMSRRIWTWDLDTRDWTGLSQSTIVDYVVENAYAGSSVLMHMQHAAFNETALSQIKDGLAERGLSVCRNNGPVGIYPQTLDC